jgi:phosphoglycerate dehydrogenase-like enzyme
VKVLLPAPLALTPEPVPGVEFVAYDPTRELPAEVRDAEGLVHWGNDRRNLSQAASSLHSLRWVQTLAAGSDAVVAAGFAPGVRISSGQSLHDDTVSEHALALTLALVRDLPGMMRGQQRAEWSGAFQEAQAAEGSRRHGPVRTLAGARTVLWGFGSIGRRLGPILRDLGADVVGVARSARIEDGITVVPAAGLAELLPEADILLMVLPGTPENRHALSRERLALLKPGAWIVNVGRGSTLDESALVEALDAGRVAGAALDVFETEPLPSSSPLWARTDVLITPHVAGGRPRGAAELIVRNLERLRTGEPLVNEVDRSALGSSA